MKRILLGVIAALCTAAGVPLQPHYPLVLHYFHIKAGFSYGLFSQFQNYQLDQGMSYDSGPNSSGCDGGSYRCVVAFTDHQITHTYYGGTKLFTCVGNYTFAQTIAVTIYTRSST